MSSWAQVHPRYIVPRYRLDALNNFSLEISVSKFGFHHVADVLPPCGAYQSTNVAIGWKFHITIGQQEVDQHAVVVRGIPDTQLREDIQRAPL
jgi:hypothetical protein